MDSLSLSLTDVADAEFAPGRTYLNTASCGLLPRRTAAAVRVFADEAVAGGAAALGSFDSVTAARAAFGRLMGVPAERVSTGSAVATHVGLVAASLPEGAEVLAAEGDFSSVINPFVVRRDLKVRLVPLEALAESVRPGTALIAVSAVQSADGRIADLPAIRAAATAHGARTLVDASQAAGWLPLNAGDYDYTVTGGYKWLLAVRGASYLTVTEEAQESLVPIHAGWVSGEDPWGSTYGPVEELARSARRFDEGPAFVAYHAAEQSFALIEGIGVERIHGHNTTLAARYRAGLAELGLAPVPGESPIVSVPGLAHRQEDVARAGILTSARAGNLRAAFHFYNSAADVDRLLDVLSG
ncbi:aminotransferase class V-fold PLP-dependent enzyme [Streptomyces sp. A3M-1-3]|nr:aminotransferase class V-fold PLP-dependent enzyme [Streptomyces sp. A3M-1-3]MCP3821314.1 aminotransferase class V-fold PLP-dependent enzyme [Streptomyces sp. A3M-1-3]